MPKLRRDAKIWSLYLTEAEEEANQQADLWNTDLEYLLIFVSYNVPASEMILICSVGWSVCRSCSLFRDRQQTRSPAKKSS